MFGLGMQEVLIIALVILLLFGGKKIPELMKGLGKGVKSFKEGMNGIDDEKNGDETKTIETKNDDTTVTIELPKNENGKDSNA